jgi:hypothetical protein
MTRLFNLVLLPVVLLTLLVFLLTSRESARQVESEQRPVPAAVSSPSLVRQSVSIRLLDTLQIK